MSLVPQGLPAGLTPEATTGLVSGALLHALRLVPVAALSPFLGGPLVPPVTRLLIGAGAGLAAFLLGGAVPVETGGALAALALREVSLGVLLALLAAAPLEAARAAGRLADTARGATLAELHVAPIRQRETALGDLAVHQVVLLAALGGGARLVVRGLLLSFQAIPAGAPVAAASWRELGARVAAATLAAAVAVAAPAVAGVLAADLAVGAMARVAPGLPLPELAQPARAALGLAAFAAAAAAGAGRLVELTALAATWPAALSAGGAP